MYFNISVDVDTCATDYLCSGCNTEKMVIASYDTGLKKLLMYFQQKNIQVTVFVIASHIKILFDSFVFSLKKYNFLQPNNFIYWGAIKFGCRDGLTHFDLGRSLHKYRFAIH